MAKERDPNDLSLSSPEYDDHALVVLASKPDDGRWLLTVGWADEDGPTDIGCVFELPGSMRREDVHDMARLYMRVFDKGIEVAEDGDANG